LTCLNKTKTATTGTSASTLAADVVTAVKDIEAIYKEITKTAKSTLIGLLIDAVEQFVEDNCNVTTFLETFALNEIVSKVDGFVTAIQDIVKIVNDIKSLNLASQNNSSNTNVATLIQNCVSDLLNNLLMIANYIQNPASSPNGYPAWSAQILAQNKAALAKLTATANQTVNYINSL